MSFKNIEIVHVVAMDRQQCIGKNNDLPWHLPADLKHFKEITQGGVIIMGRKTLESMGRALPKRMNWVITRDASWQFDGVKTASSIEEALENSLDDVANSTQPSKVFIIGGGEIFTQTINIADCLELTHIDLAVESGNAYYPNIPNEFHKVSSSEHYDETNNIHFEFATYRK
ncbi:dihydrofolate reductase [Acinetobacter nectaris]|uniref:dihydrofolate reductase n=1 Tax=Acinetobacter nectaris TaxID=1219382 RepID=UPI001F48F8E4|nr:dihydrofolate reductase [Acinetobacter nectaris]MCF9033457.1 dihydrofolate reductase [Acinetobacter nectaris]